MREKTAIVAGMIVLAACAPVQKENLPSFRTLGIGIIENVNIEEGDQGESAETRAAVGFLAGGLIVMAGALQTEDNLQRTTRWRYEVTMNGQTRSFLSHAVLKKGDCIEVIEIDDSSLTVLTRIKHQRCAPHR